MSAECPACLPLDCSGLPDDALYSLESETFPFVLVCPRGFDCSHNADIHLVCCGQELAVTFPPAATQDQRRDITASLVAECSRRQQFCGEFNPPSGDPTIPPPPTRTLYFNEPAYCDVKCPDGGEFRYRVMAGIFIMPTLQQANYVAAQYACRLAKDHQICLSDLLTDPVCAGVAYSQSIKATGKYLAVYPDADWWEISEGTLPPGLTFHGGFLTPHQVLIDGTPTTAGVYTFTVRVTEQTIGPAFGDYTEKEYTITVAAISPSSLPDGTIGTAYSQQFTVDPDHDVETEVWTLSSGTLPAGLMLSEDGLLSGTPTGSPGSSNLTFQVQFEDTATGKAVTCAKAYIFKVLLVPIEYWKMDEAGGNRIGQVTGLVLAPNVTVGSAPGVILDAAQLDNFASVFDFHLLSTGATTVLGDRGVGWTVAGWVNILTLNQRPLILGFSNGFVTANLTADWDGINFRAGGVDNNSNSFIATAPDLMPLGTFFFFRIWFNPVDGKVRCQINNGGIGVSSGVVSFPVTTKGALEMFPGGSVFGDPPGIPMLVDEIGIYMPFLSDAEATYLYNAGAGKTCCPFA